MPLQKGIALFVVAGWAATVLFALPVWAAPKPSLVPLPETWQMELELHGDPEQVTVTLPGSTESKTYWYLLYTITNHTGQDVVFYPKIEMFTDTFKLYRSGENVRRPVFEAIRQRYQHTIPLMEPENMITGQAELGQAKGILQGKDNARDSVAIFEQFDPNASRVKIFFAGLSNETVTVKLDGTAAEAAEADESPETDAAKAEQKQNQVVLRKTLVLEYQVVGDKYNPEKRVLLYRNRYWVMR